MRCSKKAGEKHLAKKVTEDSDAQLFLRRRKEPLEDCLAAIERRIGHIKKQRA